MSSLVFILTTILKQQICSVQVKIQDWNSKDKEGGVEGQIRQRKTEKRKTIPPFVADDLIPVPGCSGVWEKHFPLVLLHSCSQWKSHIRDNIQNSSLVSCFMWVDSHIWHILLLHYMYIDQFISIFKLFTFDIPFSFLKSIMPSGLRSSSKTPAKSRWEYNKYKFAVKYLYTER